MRLIDADKLENTLSGLEEEYKAEISQDGRTEDPFSDGILSAMFTVFGEIKKAPAVDAVPVIHAHWIKQNGFDNLFACSNCEEFTECGEDNYCRHCGAKMDEKTEEKK